MCLKLFNLIVIRENIQERSKQQNYYEESNNIEKLYAISVRKDKSKEEEEKIDSTLETYIISLEVNTPIIQNLFDAIAEVCPDLKNKRQYYLYWRYSLTKLLPISNYMTYCTALQLMANKNNTLYAVVRDWNTSRLEDFRGLYKVIPEDLDVVMMIAPKLTVFTIYQEEQLLDSKKAGLTEYSKVNQNANKKSIKESNTKKKK